MEATGGASVVLGGGRDTTSTHVTRTALGKNILLLITFVTTCFCTYSPMWFNAPAFVGGNSSAAEWADGSWDWDFVDCLYFAMVTMTTVGYGDMPTLRQSMRLWTMVFGFVGVTVVAGSITVIADWISELGRKRFVLRQRVLLADAVAVGGAVRQTDGGKGPGYSSSQTQTLASGSLSRVQRALKVVKAMRWTGLFFGLCVVLGEVENASVSVCKMRSWAS